MVIAFELWDTLSEWQVAHMCNIKDEVHACIQDDCSAILQYWEWDWNT